MYQFLKPTIITVFYILCFSFLKPVFAQQPEISIKAATTAYNQFRVQESRNILERIINSTQTATKERTEAMQNLAIQDWKIFRNYSDATEKLNKALLWNEDKSKIYLTLGQIDLEAGKYNQALGYSQKAIDESKNESDKLNASLLKAEIIHNKSFEQAKHEKTSNKKQLSEASGLLKHILAKQPGRPKPSELLIGISLLRQNGADLLAAWKSYYFVSDEKNINQVISPSYAVLKSVLPDFKRGSELTISEREKIIKALASSQFYNYASALATSKVFGTDFNKKLNDPAISKAIQFENYIEQIGKVNAAFYPKIAAGMKHYEPDYDTAITKAAKELWIKMESGNSISNYNEDVFFEQIKKYFGADGYIGTTVGYHSMLLGLIIHNEKKEINQYGYKANFSYISISRLISKDFTSWYGATNVGGWGTDSIIFQIRDAYLNDPFTRLNWMADTAVYNSLVVQIEVAKSKDEISLRKDIYSEPTFLSSYLKLNASKIIFDSLKRKGLENEALYLAFVSEIMRLSIEATVFAHEGRHAIDQLFFKAEFDTLSQDERELRAKFSEVIFSSNPKLALTGSIFGSNLDTATHHGKANYRFRKIIENWMKEHNNEITNLDISRPLLLQIDLLTQDQIKAICLSADPLALKINK